LKKYPSLDIKTPEFFADPNFKLVVLESLLHAGALDLGSADEFFAFIYGKEVNPENYGGQINPKCLEYLYRYPLTPELLSRVEEIVFDGGSEIYFLIDPYWNGEGEEFDVKSLAGIANCPNIRSIEINSMLEDTDLSAFVKLQALELLSLTPSPYLNFQSLLSLKNLKKIEMFSSSAGGLEEKAIEALKQKGVEIKIYE
jgi:hypothetical protein